MSVINVGIGFTLKDRTRKLVLTDAVNAHHGLKMISFFKRLWLLLTENKMIFSPKKMVLNIIRLQPDTRWYDLNTPKWLTCRDYVQIAHELIEQGEVVKIRHEATTNCEEWYGYAIKYKPR